MHGQHTGINEKKKKARFIKYFNVCEVFHNSVEPLPVRENITICKTEAFIEKISGMVDLVHHAALPIILATCSRY